ncbi:MAG: hypothetical protein ACK5MY_18985 [Jhaorihella sp.]
MARKFIIHIGPAKTGTSSLQEVLFASRERLLAAGFDYPGFGRHPQMQKIPGHHGIPARLRGHGEMPEGVLEHLAALPRERTFILSSEDFSYVDTAGIRALAEALGGDGIEVVYYARRWDQLLPSIWQELIKHGQSLPYLEFLNRQTAAPRASFYLNYAVPLDRWSQVLGPGRVRVFSYDNIREAGGDIVGHFCEHVLGLSLERDGIRQDNRRQSASLTETLRMLNRLALGRGHPVPRVRFALTRARAEVEDELAALEAIHAGHIGEAQPCAPMVFREVERTFLKSYAGRLENPTPEGRLFAERPFESAPFVRPDYLFETPALGIYRDILQKIGERAADAA